MNNIPMPAIEWIESYVKYHPAIGKFTSVKSGKEVGYIQANGYIYVRVGAKQYRANRLAWYLTHQENPDVVDHINRIKTDNRICNLRAATNHQSACNRGLTKLNSSGIKGAFWNKIARRWLAAIQVNKKNIYLGYFDTKFEAGKAYEIAAKKFHGEFASPQNDLIGKL